MKIGSISGLVYASSDLDKTAAFYESLGFRAGKRSDTEYTCYVNWFWLTFSTEAAAAAGPGATLYMKVDSIDEAYGFVVANGFAPLDEPHKDKAGRRVFTLPDPDGNLLAFFTK
ncbi:VOC family protein [Actinoplanes bogorensis]|uniref:VOC family protein n=1 Tax=Paractinoplanes bogorensis TaxID=1610840 RepID=A0ABS5Z060_9ACTN|nr:VOC family protein [Actinoplanes bogorensis]MBU2669084.1 VOC family protein [Actinoplanes bogorensis]